MCFFALFRRKPKEKAPSPELKVQLYENKVQSETRSHLKNGTFVKNKVQLRNNKVQLEKSKVQIQEEKVQVFEGKVQNEIIGLIIKNPQINQKEIAEHIGKSERTTKTIMKNMQEQKLIQRSGSKKTGSWEVIKIISIKKVVLIKPKRFSRLRMRRQKFQQKAGRNPKNA